MYHSRRDIQELKYNLISQEYRKWVKIWVAITREEDGINESIMDLIESDKGNYIKELKKLARKYKNNKGYKKKRERELFVSLDSLLDAGAEM